MKRSTLKQTLIGCLFLGIAGALTPGAAMAWGDEGHRVVALIAERLMTPRARAGVDALLIQDHDTLTAPDFASRATWADKYREQTGSRTSSWHFVDIEIDRPDIAWACYQFPRAAYPASEGPARDCIIDKIGEFEVELGSAGASVGEQILALKYLLHFVGDVHQPLHATDDHDRGGNCEWVTYSGLPKDGGQPGSSTLHAYWDTVVIEKQNPRAEVMAHALGARITRRDIEQWKTGSARDWASESHAVGRTVAYNLGPRAHCRYGDRQPPIPLTPQYERAAEQAADIQLEKAGVRLAVVLNRAFAGPGR